MIKTWNQRCQEHPDHQTGMVSHSMIQARMQEEIDDLRAALAQPEQEPVAWMYEGEPYFDGKENNFSWCYTSSKSLAEFKSGTVKKPRPLYTAPPQRKPLTDEEIAQIDWKDGETLHDFARAIEKAHGIGG